MSRVREGLNSIAKKTRVKKTRKCVIQIKCEEHFTTFIGFLILGKTQHSVKKKSDETNLIMRGLRLVYYFLKMISVCCLLVCFIILRKALPKQIENDLFLY